MILCVCSDTDRPKTIKLKVQGLLSFIFQFLFLAFLCEFFVPGLILWTYPRLCVSLRSLSLETIDLDKRFLSLAGGSIKIGFLITALKWAIVYNELHVNTTLDSVSVYDPILIN